MPETCGQKGQNPSLRPSGLPCRGLRAGRPGLRGSTEPGRTGPPGGRRGPWPRSGHAAPRRRARARRPLAGALAAEGRERRRGGLFAPTGCRWSCPAPARGKAPGKRSSSPWPARAGNSAPRMQFVLTWPQSRQLGIQGLGLDSGSWSWAQALPQEEVCHQMVEGMPPHAGKCPCLAPWLSACRQGGAGG